jgi:hypothetical protein
MVTAVAHVWFNTFFEGNGPEQNGIPDDSGVFEISWDAMDGIKGSSRKGTQAFEKIAVVWKALPTEGGKPGVVITEPKEGEEVKQSSPADWKGQHHVTPNDGKDIGMRISSPTASNTDISRASSVKSQNAEQIPHVLTKPFRSSEDSDTKAVKPHGLDGEDVIREPRDGSGSGPTSGAPAPPSTHLGPLTSSNEAVDGGTQSLQAHHPSEVEGIVSGVQHISTDDLPDGRPEAEMKDAKEHGLFHLGKKKPTSS